MGQFAAAIRGMAAACKALDFPVVSGNVTLYNETAGRAAILPTPAIGGVGVLDDAAQAVGLALPPVARPRADRRHHRLARPVALAARDRRPRGRRPAAGRPRRRTPQRRFRARPDPGRRRSAPATTSPMAACWWRWPRWPWPAATGARLSHQPARDPRPRLLVRRGPGPLRRSPCPMPASLLRAAEAAGMPAVRIGTSGGQDLTLPDGGTISVAGLRAAHERFFPSWMDGPATDQERAGWRWQPGEIEALIKAAICPTRRSPSRTWPATATTTPPPSSRETFRGMSRVKQHQIVYAALRGRMGGELHALALQTSAPE